jgi:hypothetical protein
MRRLFLAIGLAALLGPLPGSAQFGPGGYGDRAEQLVGEWYSRYLGRDPDPYAATWIGSLRSGQTPEAVLAQILASDEYYLRAGNTPEGFVSTLYQQLTGRLPSRGEAQAWLGRVYHGERQDVAYQMLMRYPQDWGRVPSPRFRDEERRDRDRYEPEEHRFRRPLLRVPPRW